MVAKRTWPKKNRGITICYFGNAPNFTNYFSVDYFRPSGKVVNIAVHPWSTEHLIHG